MVSSDGDVVGELFEIDGCKSLGRGFLYGKD